jgi:tetratricopeptide (TPR) repeat protein
MKPLFIVLLLLPMACSPPSDLTVSKKFQEAQERFNGAETSDDFLQAANLYEQILAAGVVNGAVLYNLGNAYMFADERGRAIAAYRQAQRYRPRDPFLESNLAYALGGEALPDRRRSIIDHVLFWKDLLSYPEKFHLTLAAGVLALCLALTALYARNRRIWKRLALLGSVVTLLLAVSAGFDVYRYEFIKHGVVTGEGVVARKGNAETWEPAFTEALPEGTEFQVRDQRNAWLLIRLETGLEGWIPETQATVY